MNIRATLLPHLPTHVYYNIFDKTSAPSLRPSPYEFAHPTTTPRTACTRHGLPLCIPTPVAGGGAGANVRRAFPAVTAAGGQPLISPLERKANFSFALPFFLSFLRFHSRTSSPFTFNARLHLASPAPHPSNGNFIRIWRVGVARAVATAALPRREAGAGERARDGQFFVRVVVARNVPNDMELSCKSNDNSTRAEREGKRVAAVVRDQCYRGQSLSGTAIRGPTACIPECSRVPFSVCLCSPSWR